MPLVESTVASVPVMDLLRCCNYEQLYLLLYLILEEDLILLVLSHPF